MPLYTQKQGIWQTTPEPKFGLKKLHLKKTSVYKNFLGSKVAQENTFQKPKSNSHPVHIDIQSSTTQKSEAIQIFTPTIPNLEVPFLQVPSISLNLLLLQRLSLQKNEGL